MSGASIDAAFASLAGLNAGRAEASPRGAVDAGAWSAAFAKAGAVVDARAGAGFGLAASPSSPAVGRSFELASFTPAAMGSNAAFARPAFATAMPAPLPAAGFPSEPAIPWPRAEAVPRIGSAAGAAADPSSTAAGASSRAPTRGDARAASPSSRACANAAPETHGPRLRESLAAAAARGRDGATRAAASEPGRPGVVDLPSPDGPPWRVHLQWRGAIADAWIGLDARAADLAREVVAALRAWIRDQGGEPGRIVLNGHALSDARPHPPFEPLGEP